MRHGKRPKSIAVIAGLFLISISFFTPSTSVQSESGSWFNPAWKERVTIWVNETNGVDQGEILIDYWMDFSRYNLGNATNEIRVTYLDPTSNQEIERPFQIMSERSNSTCCFESRVIFKTSYLSANQDQIYYIYFNNKDASPSSLLSDFNSNLIKNRIYDPVYENNNYDLQGAMDVDIDQNDYIYVVDRGNHRVQIFDRNGTYYSTLGVPRESGSDNKAFSHPTGICTCEELVLVVDSGNHRVQIFDTQGKYLQTLGTGSAGDGDDSFNSPKDAAVTPDGKIFVTDYGNHRVQVFDDRADGIADRTLGITGISGIANDELNYPYGIAVSSGNLYIADSGNHRVQILTLDGDYVDTIGTVGTLGSSIDHFFYPYGVDVDDEGNIYIADYKNQRVQVYNGNHEYQFKIGTTLESGTDAGHFDHPSNLAVDNGKIFVADYGNNRVQVFEDDGIFLKSIGADSEHTISHFDFYDPRDVTVGPDDRVYVSDRMNHRVQVLGPDFSYLFTIGTSGESGSANTHLNQPYDVDISNNWIVVADSANNRIQFFDLGGTYLRTLEGSGSHQLNYPCGVKVCDEQELIAVADTYNDRIEVYDFNFTFIAEIDGGDPSMTSTGDPSSIPSFKHPYDVEIDDDCMLYVLDTDHLCVQVFWLTNYSYSHTLFEGVYWDPVKMDWIGGGIGPNQLQWPCGMELYQDKLYIADTYNHRVQVTDLEGNWLQTLGYNGTSGSDSLHFSKPRGVGVRTNGGIMVADANNNRIQYFNKNGNFIECYGFTDKFIFNNKHFYGPEGLAIDTDGGIYVADSNNHRVQVFDAFGTYKFTLGSSSKRESGSDLEHLYTPSDVAIGNNKIYVADKGNERIQVFNMNGNYLSTLDVDCYGIIVGTNGNLYAADAPEHCIRVLDPNGAPLQILGIASVQGNDSAHMNFPVDLGINENGKIFVADNMNHRVLIFNDIQDSIADGQIGITLESGSDMTHLFSPHDVACENGLVYITDTGNQRVQVFTEAGVYVDTLGITGKSGCDNLHFNGPHGICVTENGRMYVVDTNNHRIVVISDIEVGIGSHAAYEEISTVDDTEEEAGMSQFFQDNLLLILLLIVLVVIVVLVALLMLRKKKGKGSRDELPDLNWSLSYLFKEEKPEKAFQYFRVLSSDPSVDPLLIARTPPNEVEMRYKCQPKKMLWLSRVDSNKPYVESISSSPLVPLLDRISTYIDQNQRPLVLLEGVEHLISENGFEDVLKFLDSVTPDISTHKGILIVPVDDKTMTLREFSLLARNMHVKDD